MSQIDCQVLSFDKFWCLEVFPPVFFWTIEFIYSLPQIICVWWHFYYFWISFVYFLFNCSYLGYKFAIVFMSVVLIYVVILLITSEMFHAPPTMLLVILAVWEWTFPGGQGWHPAAEHTMPLPSCVFLAVWWQNTLNKKQLLGNEMGSANWWALGIITLASDACLCKDLSTSTLSFKIIRRSCVWWQRTWA